MNPLSESPVSTVPPPVEVWLPVEPMDPGIRSIQPGGGVVMRLELAWGRVRRSLLKRFWPAYVAAMRAKRQGEFNGCPHDVVDSRDLKFYRNQGGHSWAPGEDPFAWRDCLPVARAGLAELVLGVGLCLAGAGLLGVCLLSVPVSGVVSGLMGTGVVVLLGLAGLTTWFFRDPQRAIPAEPGAILSPADGKVVSIERLPHDEFVGGRAIRVGIFLSIFNVHVNRAPCAARVIGLTYRPGKYLNALRAESARENESLEVRLQAVDDPSIRLRVRQISGAIARRIVCWLKPGDLLARGERFGMIKLGSRTELVLPEEAGLTLRVAVGETVRAGVTVMAGARLEEAVCAR
jgi:phosphatidylserine decarboxylase